MLPATANHKRATECAAQRGTNRSSGAHCTISGRLILGASFLCFLAALASAVMALRRPSEAPLLATPRVHDAGVVRQAETINAEFELTNASRRSIRILSLNPDCACTAWSVSKKDLLPGESCRLSLDIDVGTARGDLVRKIVVPYEIEGSKRPVVVNVVVRATIDVDFKYSPTSLSFSRAAAGEAGIDLHASTWLPQLSVTDAFANRTWLAVSGIHNSDDRGNASVLVQFSGDVASGLLDDGAQITIRTNPARQPIVRIPVKLTD